MNAHDILDMIGDAKGAYVWDAQQVRSGNIVNTPQRLSSKKMWLIVAIIAMLLMLVGCAVVYMLNIQDMKVGEENHYRDSYVTPDGETIPATEWVTTLFSLQGYNDSNCQLAMKEWILYAERYDTDNSLMKANNLNESGLPDNYFLNYNCYTWEMKEKLDEILEKYDLNALGAYVHCEWWENYILFDALQINGILRENASANVSRLAGYFTPEGTFDVEFNISLADFEWPYEIIASFRYSLIDYLDPIVGGVRNIETVDQWNYVLDDGTQLLLVQDGNVSMIICNKGKAFITITLNDFSDEDGLSKMALEQLAQVFDYNVSPQTADMEKVEQMLAKSEEPYNPSVHGYYIGFSIGQDGTFHPPEGYGDSIKSYLSYVEQNADPVNKYYTLVDVDNDGADEILLGSANGQLYEMVDMQNGEVTIRFLTYLCEGNILERYYDNDTYYFSDNVYEEGCISREYRTLLESIVRLYYLPKSDQWINVKDGDEADEAITTLEARQIIGLYPRLELDMKPLSEFPVETEIGT